MTKVDQMKLTMEQIRLSIAEKKLNLLSTQTKNDELNYTANLLDKYMLWKQQGMTDNQILRIYPGTNVVIDALKEEVDTSTSTQ
jgi:cell division protein ZapA (FtsZ GTPase activity inhibitor)